MNKPPLRILSNMARSGGTLVSKCLGSMNDVVLLSEIHPLGTHIFNPVEQAGNWYQLLENDTGLDGLALVDSIQLIHERCSQSGKTLLIRDWAHLDFIGIPFTNKPVYRQQLNEVLSPFFNIIQHTLVRHPIDQWISTSRLKIMQGQLDIETFISGYRHFAELGCKSGFTRYEDFTSDPENSMIRICHALQISYDPEFLVRWSGNASVTGDTSGQSRGSQTDTIKPLKRGIINPSDLSLLQNNPDYTTAVKLLGYDN